MPLKIKTQFKEALSYLKESSNYIIITILLFIISGFLGFFYRSELTFLNKVIAEIVIKTQGLNSIEMIFFILQNNLQSSFLAVILGIAFGIIPIINSIFNGTIIGYVLGLAYDIGRISEWWRLLPHGIFELPAMFISISLGMKLGFSIFLSKKLRAKEFKRRFYNAMNVFLMIVIPLLIIAAIIEGLLIAAAG